MQALKAVYPQIMTKIRFQLAPKPTSAEKEQQGQSGFVPIPIRWVYAFGGAKPYERSNAWIDRCKILLKIL
jgi:hypothetical protein